MKVESHELGTLLETETFLALFGNRDSQISNVQQMFQGLKFKRIKQVHGNRVVHTSPHSIDFSSEADAHYTSDQLLGLCIATADCVPVLLYHDNPRWICSIHAGWRGVENRILSKAVSSLSRAGCKPESLQVFVGPHIQRTSFEVGNDVRDQLLKSFKGDPELVWDKVTEHKSKVDLHQILKFQMLEHGISLDHAFFEMKDTVTDASFHSFRRDRENSGRQLSFIALKK